MSQVNQPRYAKNCQFTEEEWRWLQNYSIELRLTMMDVIHRVIRDCMGRWDIPTDAGSPFSEEEVLAEHRQNLEIVIGNTDEINFRYERIFCPYVNSLPIADERKADIIKKGGIITIEYLGKVKDDTPDRE